jgi:hypothetical protein
MSLIYLQLTHRKHNTTSTLGPYTEKLIQGRDRARVLNDLKCVCGTHEEAVGRLEKVFDCKDKDRHVLFERLPNLKVVGRFTELLFTVIVIRERNRSLANALRQIEEDMVFARVYDEGDVEENIWYTTQVLVPVHNPGIYPLSTK